MQELKPFKTIGPLKKALDNGGRFYNFFDEAGDEVVTRSELAKAAGVYTASIQAFLYLEMTKQDLDEKDQEAVLALLEAKLRTEFQKKKPPHVAPAQVDAEHRAGEAIIVTGFTREIAQESRFVGFVTVPIMIGKVFVPMMIPIHNLFRVIEVCADEAMSKPNAVVCVPVKAKYEAIGLMQFGGVLKKMESRTKEPPTHPVFLDVIFWMKR